MCGSSASVRRVRRVQVAVVALVACACLEVCLAAAQWDHSNGRALLRGSTGSGTYCGGRLSDALKFMCNGQYNSYFKTKKTPPAASDPHPQAQGSVRKVRQDEGYPAGSQLPFRERLRAAAFLESRTRFRRGVFDECCTKSCTIDELMAYCELHE